MDTTCPYCGGSDFLKTCTCDDGYGDNEIFLPRPPDYNSKKLPEVQEFIDWTWEEYRKENSVEAKRQRKLEVYQELKECLEKFTNEKLLELHQEWKKLGNPIHQFKEVNVNRLAFIKRELKRRKLQW